MEINIPLPQVSDKFKIEKFYHNKETNCIDIGLKMIDLRYSTKYPELGKEADYIMLTYNKEERTLLPFHSKIAKYKPYNRLGEDFFTEDYLSQDISRLLELCLVPVDQIETLETEEATTEVDIPEQVINIREFNEIVFDNQIKYDLYDEQEHLRYEVEYQGVKFIAFVEHKEENNV